MAEEHISLKCCRHFGVVSNSLKVASSTNANLPNDLDWEKQQKYRGYKKFKK